jgi:hypothetical protein
MHPMQDYFWKVFHKYYNLICIFICTPICTKNFILTKSGCYIATVEAVREEPFSPGGFFNDEKKSVDSVII